MYHVCIYLGWNSLNHDSLRCFSNFFGRRDFFFSFTCTKAIDCAMALKPKPQLQCLFLGPWLVSPI